MKHSKGHKVYEYLEKSGVLTNGTDEEIQKVRNEYWRIYKRNWRKNKRKSETEVTSSFTDKEFNKISNHAKLHNLSNPQFLKKAALAYLEKKYLVPNESELRKITQKLSQKLDLIIDLLDERNIRDDLVEKIISQLEELEKNINTSLRNPRLI